jgi:hypothetical protein
MQTWQDEMRALKLAHFKSISKEFYRLNGGDSMIIRGYSDGSVSSFKKAVIDYLAFNGFCTYPIMDKRRTAILTEINSRTIQITIKSTRQPNQRGLPQPGKVDEKGIYHIVVDNMPAFLQQFKTKFPNAVKAVA